MSLFTDLFRQHLFADLGYSVLAVSLALIRMLAFVHFAPIFSHKSVPAHARIGFAVFLTAIFAGRAQVEALPEEGYSLFYAIATNLLLGFIMGYTANVLFVTITAGGEMMDSAMGFSAGQSFDPGLGTQTTIIGKFMTMLSAVIFFAIGGPETLIQALSASFDAFSIYAPNLTMNVWKLVHLVGGIITMGFVLVSPMVITILINDLVLGLLSRASPQINAFQISFTIKPSVGNLIWSLILPLFIAAVANFFADRLHSFF